MQTRDTPHPVTARTSRAPSRRHHRAEGMNFSRARSLHELRHACSGRRISELSSGDLRGIARKAREFAADEAIRLACLGNVTLDPLPEVIEAVAFCAGVDLTALAGRYDQYMQELMDAGSSVRRFAPDIVSLSLDMRALDADLYFNCSTWPPAQVAERRDDLLDRVASAVDTVLVNTTASCILFNFPAPTKFRLGIADGKRTHSEFAFYAGLNLALAERFRAKPRVQIVDVETLSAAFGKQRAFDNRMFYLAKLPWHESFLPALAEEIVRHIEAATGRTRKCLVLDLDNTLWGGVLGEEGPFGISIGPGDPVGEAFLDFQMRIKGMQERGIILAICSKNNPADVEELFESRKDMPLKRSDFAATEVGWDSKNLGLERIADRLGLGTDSLVYIDDNPAEIRLINETMPEVATLLLPGDPARYSDALDGLHGLDKATVSADDARKQAQYSERAQRESSRQQFTDLGAYLKSLGTHISVWLAAEPDIKRIHELFSKTNQFNSTTKRYTLAEIESFMRSPEHDLIAFSATDRFGDLGTIGVSLVRLASPETAEIDSFIMSCRAIGRGIESAVLNQLQERYLDSPRFHYLDVDYVPSRKNAPFRKFLDEHAFRKIRDGESGAAIFRLDADAGNGRRADWITIDKGIDQ